MIERSGYKFFVKLGYENLSTFCKNRSAVGHLLANCQQKKNKNKNKQTNKQTTTPSHETLILESTRTKEVL